MLQYILYLSRDFFLNKMKKETISNAYAYIQKPYGIIKNYKGQLL